MQKWPPVAPTEFSTPCVQPICAMFNVPSMQKASFRLFIFLSVARKFLSIYQLDMASHLYFRWHHVHMWMIEHVSPVFLKKTESYRAYARDVIKF